MFLATFDLKHLLTTDGGRSGTQFERTDPGEQGGQWPLLNAFIFPLLEVFVIGDRSINKLTKALMERYLS